MTMNVSYRINPLLIGYGYWGKNLLRNLIDNPNSGTINVCDVDTDKLEKIFSPHLVIAKETDTHQAISNPKVDAVIIATPTSTHFELAKVALQYPHPYSVGA